MTVKGYLEGLITETIQSHILPLSPLKAIKRAPHWLLFRFCRNHAIITQTEVVALEISIVFKTT